MVHLEGVRVCEWIHVMVMLLLPLHVQMNACGVS